MRQSRLTFLLCQFLDRFNWIGDQFIQRQGGIRNTVDERGVGAIFQQTTNQVSQQRFMCANGCINTAWAVEFTVCDFAGDLFVQRFTHAVQALELILTRIVVLAC